MLGLQQISYAYQRGLSISYDPAYYSQIRSTYSDTSQAVSLSAYSSLGALNGNGTKWLAVAYHTAGYDNLISSSQLHSICLTEHNILTSLPCVTSGTYKSIIPAVYNPNTCVPLPGVTRSVFAEYQNAGFVQDNINNQTISSNVIISYFRTGSCDNIGYATLGSDLSSLAVGSIQTTFIDKATLHAEYTDQITNVFTSTGIVILIAAIMMLIGLRGLIITITIFWSMLVSFVSAIGVLPYANYEHFSIYNVIAIYMLIAVCSTTVFFYGSAWRRTLPVYAKLSGRRIMKTYQLMSLALVFMFCISFITYISKVSSNILALNQLGLFMAVSTFVFLSHLHALIIPAWVYLSFFRLFPYNVRETYDKYFEVQVSQEYGNNYFFDYNDDYDNYEVKVLDEEEYDDEADEEAPDSEGGDAGSDGTYTIPIGQPDSADTKDEEEKKLDDADSANKPSRRASFQLANGARRSDSPTGTEANTPSVGDASPSRPASTRRKSAGEADKLKRLSIHALSILSPREEDLAPPEPAHSESIDRPDPPAALTRVSSTRSLTVMDERIQRLSMRISEVSRSINETEVRQSESQVTTMVSVEREDSYEVPKTDVSTADDSRARRSSVFSAVSTYVWARRASVATNSHHTQRQSIYIEHEEEDPRDYPKALARYYGVLAVFVWMLVAGLAGGLGYYNIKVDLTNPLLFTKNSNIGHANYIDKFYKSGILADSSYPDGAFSSLASPSAAQSASTHPGQLSSADQSYYVSTCYGVNYYKQSLDKPGKLFMLIHLFVYKLICIH